MMFFIPHLYHGKGSCFFYTQGVYTYAYFHYDVQNKRLNHEKERINLSSIPDPNTMVLLASNGENDNKQLDLVFLFPFLSHRRI